MKAARAIVKPEKGRFPIRLINPNPEPAKVYPRTTLGTLEQFDTVLSDMVVAGTDVTTEPGATSPVAELLEQIVERNCSELSDDEKGKFLHLLSCYSSISALSDLDMGRTTKLQHYINTGDATPVRQAVCRITPNKREEVRNLIGRMLDKDVIQQSTSPWAAPIMLVKKKDGSTRFCVDYRKLNHLIRKDAYPLPQVDMTLDTLAGSQWFSTMDLLSGYWQVEIAESDCPKTAFTTTEGLFKFKVMPFGLCNALATFQWLMDLVLAGLQWAQCLVYIDDVVVVGRTFDKHLQNLKAVFERLRQAGLKLKPSKCVFFQRSVQYLGYIVSTRGIQPDPEKLEKVNTWPTPSSVKSVQQFLGFANYYRRFVRNFAKIA